MTEQAWLSCDHPARLLRYLRRRNRPLPGKVHLTRKGRLYGCGCCRRAWHILGKASQALVEAVERAAEAEVNEIDWQTTQAVRACAACVVWLLFPYSQATANVAVAARLATARKAHKGAGQQAYAARRAVIAQERASQAALLRCVFGNPFRTITLARSLLTSAVLALASDIYQERDFAAMPILADALEDAGCTDLDILGHLRGPAPHARGCHVLDLILSQDR
jgi:hypothetical protein